MSKIEKMCQPLNAHEDNFIVMISTFSDIGYGRMKQIITGLWANILMESSAMDEECALLGALDLDSWTQAEKEKLQHQLEIQTKRVENLKKMFMYGDVNKYTFLEVEKDQKDYHIKDVWMMEEESDFEQLGERIQWGVTVPKMVGGKLARSCQAIDQELEKQLEEVK